MVLFSLLFVFGGFSTLRHRPPLPLTAQVPRVTPPPSPQGRAGLWRTSFIKNRLLKTHFSITVIYHTQIPLPLPFITNGKRSSVPRKASRRQFRGGRRPLRGDHSAVTEGTPRPWGSTLGTWRGCAMSSPTACRPSSSAPSPMSCPTASPTRAAASPHRC